MKYLLTGGGTGGHVYPALAIADEIKRRQPDAEFLYVGRRDKLEAWVVPERDYPIRFVRAVAFPRSKSIGALLSFALALFCGMVQSALILLRFRPPHHYRHRRLCQRADSLCARPSQQNRPVAFPRLSLRTQCTSRHAQSGRRSLGTSGWHCL